MKKMIRKGWFLGAVMIMLWFTLGNPVLAEEKNYQGFEYRIVLHTRYLGYESFKYYGDEEEEFAEEPVEEDLGDSLRIKKYLVITGYAGNEAEVVIPDVIDGIPVAYVEDSAFAYNTTIKKVTIPDAIETIGDGAFSNCSNLEEVYLGDLQDVPSEAFANCRKLKMVYGNPWWYYDKAFFNCSSLQNVVIPKGEEPKCSNIEDLAFAGCKNLREMKVCGASSVGYGAFYGCKKLKTFEAFSGSMFVFKRAFYGCTSLEKVIGIRAIQTDAFYGCKKLKEIEFKDNFAGIDKNALRNTNKKLKIRVKKKYKKTIKNALTKKTGYKKTMKIVVSK